MVDTAIAPAPKAAGRATLPVVLGLLAIATAIPAWVIPAISSPITAAADDESGVLGRSGVGPESIVGLRVVSWDETLAAAQPFEVKRENDRWIIPSTYGYPADGNTRVTRTAAGILGVAKGRKTTDRPAEHADLGVLDPLDPPPGATAGFGKRVTLTDATGASALDVIIGKRVETGSGVFYVREAGRPDVYTAKLEGDISTRFTDYVETDPFKIQRDAVRGVAVVDYQVDPDKGTISPGPVTRVRRDGASADWQSSQVPEGKRIAKTKVDDVLSELSWMRLQGVRPFDLRWLQSRGFYVSDQPQFFQLPNALTVQLQGKPYALFGTEGRLDVTTRDGLRYSLMFGKVALGDDEDTEADSSGKEVAEGEAAPAGNNRYLAVFVTYDATLDEEAKEQAAAAGDQTKPAPGRERAARAQARFQQFFYVVSDSTFKKLRPDVATWWEDQPAEPMAGDSGKSVPQWLTDNAQLPGVVSTASGLQYQVMTSGDETGAHPTPADSVRVSYRGTLIDGTEFDANEDMTFGVTGVIKGWTEALQLMRPGDTWKLFVPPELGYGEAGSPPKIGPHQILVFEVTLKEITGQQ